MMSDGNFTAESAAKHQAELNEYLQSKNINHLFIQIVESLLIEKPDNPIGFIVEFLQKKYPDLSGVDLARATPLPDDAAPEQQQQQDDEDEEEDYVDDLPVLKSGGAYDRDKKRNSVCAESDVGQAEIKEFDKSDSERQRIIEILEHQVLFRHLDADQKEFAARAMEPVDFKTGDVIIKQGDAGDHFYVLASGSVECYVADPQGTEKLVQTYGPGGAFGELAIMYNAPRAATCKAVARCKLYALERRAFKVIVMKTTIEKRAQAKTFLQNVEILKQLNDTELLQLADAMRELTFDDADVICRQGQPGSDFYIIKHGTVVCTQTDARGDQVEVARLGVGDYFGEIALLTSKPRQATVAAASPTLKLLSLDRPTFNRILGSIEDILRRNISAYNKFRSQHI
ncbi:hypothetical protein CTAYLR_010678 [Chrysophaeum taylorii]|uniref:Cyclic nucleotide-binding domain-containing protein n=1 Tax=Chrysophaeum taylorii TaxID=2483200 RepID=A0AAD7UJA6_9STRA|nr:hypothetical protein CTAYLR_010678 [Chrysophaeum taylorii]